jgi:TolB-like protein
MAFQPGTRLGPYEITAPLGAGGMGEVYKARDTRLAREVAIKQLNVRHSERFTQEARAIAALNHPNICQIYDVGPDYLVLEYVDGQPLTGPLPIKDVVRLATQLASALEEAHGRGILHCDLKPANILVTATGMPKLLDFGIAKMMIANDVDVTQTAEGTIVGTAAYLAPEQAQGKPLDERSDIFSFGAVLYEMVSGKRAFAGDSVVDVLTAVMRDEPPPMQAPPEISRVALRCLRKTPADRFQTMAEVRAALEAAAQARVEATAPSIAVLPFTNISHDNADEYFSDGLAEEIINALTHIRGLKVIARTSAFAFKGKSEDIRRIAHALGVTHVLEGSIRKAVNRIRVTAQLIAAVDGGHLWSERYDRELVDIFDIQDEIAGAIASALEFKLADPPRRRRLPAVAAYEAYLQARYHWAKFTPESHARSKAELERAIAVDPDFALARSELGEHFFMSYVLGLASAQDAVPLVRKYAGEALDIDPILPEAHALLGCIAGIIDYDWPEADRRFTLACSQDPVPAHVRVQRAFFFLSYVGRAREAVAEERRLLEDDPLNVSARWTMAISLQAAGLHEEAEARATQILELDHGVLSTYAALLLSANHTGRGAIPTAMALAETAYTRSPWYPPAIGQFAGLLARTGQAERAEELTRRLRPGEAFGTPCGLATYYLMLGELDNAADWFERSIEQRDLGVVLALAAGAFGGHMMWTSPRWPRLSALMKLPQARR